MPPPMTREMTMAEALRDAMRLAMLEDSRVFLIGEDIGIQDGFGGGFTVTLGLSDEFGHERVMDTPLSEAAIIGAAVGAAMVGMRPVAEMQYGDFVFVGMDQVINQAAKMHYMSNGHVSVPLVLRLPVGASRRGAQHAQSTEAYWMHTPGLKVVCPSNPFDAKGLLSAAIKDENPVIFLEHKLLYGGKGGRKEKSSIDPIMQVPLEAYQVELGTLKEVHPGKDVTILANMMMVYRSLDAAEQLEKAGISAQVIDMRCLQPIDLQFLFEAVEKTNRVLIVEEDNFTCGWGAELAARLSDEMFYHLDAPIKRIASPDTPVPTAETLEEEYLPSKEKIVEAVNVLLEGG